MSAFELLLLEQLPGVGPATVRKLIRRFGDAATALGASDASFAEALGGAHARSSAQARRDGVLRCRVEHALTRAAASGISVVSWDDDRYPAALRQLADPPPVLFLAGRPELLRSSPAVAVVGARRSTARARDVAGRLGASLARGGATVVSGLALGVDGAAHEGALRADGETIGVLGAGIDVPYPRFHRRLHQQIRERGLLVSEFPPGTAAAPHHFPRRNRVLAALSGSVVVVEAGARSGALITVDHALDLGRDVWAVPGPIDTRVCAGSNKLLVEGARPLVSIDAFVASVCGVPPVPGPSAPVEGGLVDLATSSSASVGASPPRVDAVAVDTVDAQSLERRLLGLLEDAPTQIDELARQTGEPVSTVLAVLTTLELHGEVERLTGMRFRRAA